MLTLPCGFKWKASYLLPPPSKGVTSIEQKCYLAKDHEGSHRSLTNVTKAR